MGGWVDEAPALELLRAWAASVLPSAVTVTADEAPATLTGPTVVLTVVADPRGGPPLTGLDTLDLQVQATSVGWDASLAMSLPQQAAALADMVAQHVAGTLSAGGPITPMDLAGYAVLRRTSAGDRLLSKAGELWQAVETFTLTLLADPPP